jgi:DNA-binding MarR family transcriptional regulator
MSVHVKRLEAAGLIARLAPDSEDRRRIGLVITEAGGQTLQAILRHRNDWLASRLRDLPAEAHERLKQACEPLAQLAGERP